MMSQISAFLDGVIRARAFFPVLLILNAVFASFSAFMIIKCVNSGDSVLSDRAAKALRNKTAGVILGSAVLLWCVPHTAPILPASMVKFLVPLAVILAVLSAWALDHLLARAIGGFVILSAHCFLQESFAMQSCCPAVFAAMCFVYGSVGIVLSGKPYWMKRLFEVPEKKKVLRMLLPAFLILFAVSCCIMLALNLAGGVK